MHAAVQMLKLLVTVAATLMTFSIAWRKQSTEESMFGYTILSTQLPPQMWTMVDKSTPSQTTNQAILVVACDETAVPCPIPVASPGVYLEFEQASYDVLAELLIESIENHLS